MHRVPHIEISLLRALCITSGKTVAEVQRQMLTPLDEADIRRIERVKALIDEADPKLWQLNDPKTIKEVYRLMKSEGKTFDEVIRMGDKSLLQYHRISMTAKAGLRRAFPRPQRQQQITQAV